MSERTKQINRLGDRAKRQLIKKCDREFLDCVSECAKNVIKGNVPLKPAQLRRLRRERSNEIGIEKDVVKEETDSAEGRIPRCSPSTRHKRSGQLVIGKCTQLRS